MRHPGLHPETQAVSLRARALALVSTVTCGAHLPTKEGSLPSRLLDSPFSGCSLFCYLSPWGSWRKPLVPEKICLCVLLLDIYVLFLCSSRGKHLSLGSLPKGRCSPSPCPCPVGPSGEKHQAFTQQIFLWTCYVPGTALSELITPSIPPSLPPSPHPFVHSSKHPSINLSTLHIVSDLGCCNHLEDPACQH